MSETSFIAERTSRSAPIILIVEDDEDSRAMLKTLLEMWDYSVIEAMDGEDAVYIFAKSRPDLILMDITLPSLSGFEAAQRIRESADNADVPIVFLSGYTETKYRDAAVAVGGNDYVVKPLDFEQLQNTLGKYLRH